MSGDTLETQRHFTVDTSSSHCTGRLRKQEVRAPTNQRLKKLSCGLFLRSAMPHFYLAASLAPGTADFLLFVFRCRQNRVLAVGVAVTSSAGQRVVF